MALTAGERLNGYEIVALVGAGGMGEVYRARDTRLNREVALKVLPARTADDAAAFARFEREAQAVAALSHPNILAVHDSGESGATRYVVFELLQGASLRERLESGALPVRRAVDYARQVADGLAAAHARGITHRDIKPDNLFVTDDGRVKILDFGLAQTAAAVTAAAQTGVVTQAPITDAGTVLGTVGYMAPEQVRGQAVDHRADIFALGATLYEMCTGRRAFKGASPADTMSAVLSADPPEMTIAGHTPPALDRIVRRCLEKQPSERFQSARDLSFALEALSSLSGSGSGLPAPEPSAPRGWMLPAAIAAAVALAAGVGLGRVAFPPPASAPAVVAPPALRAEFPSGIGMNTAVLLELSPDGRRLAYSDVAPVTGVRQLFVRDLGTGDVTPIEDSEDAVIGAWSPQGDALIFAARYRELRRYQVADRATSLLATLPDAFRGAAWVDDDTIVVCTLGAEPLRRYSRAANTWTTVVRDDRNLLTRPRRITGRSDYVLALRGELSRGEVSVRQVVTVRLADGVVTPLTEAIAAVSVAGGHMLFTRPGGVFAVPFDVERLQLTGDAIRVADEVVWNAANALTSFTASDSGSMAFRPASTRPLQFEWLDATGRSQGLVGPPDFYGAFALSPDGTRIVVRFPPSQAHPQGALQLIDISRGVVSPIATPPGLVSDPIWSSDGSRVLYRLAASLVRQSPFSNQPQTVRADTWFPDAVSADGRWIAAGRPEPAGGFGLFAFPADGTGQPVEIDSGSVSDEVSFSPDGKLLSFHSSRTGRSEVYLTPFPPTGERWPVSAAGGMQPRWSGDGRWLYFLDFEATLQRVAIAPGSPPRIGRPETRFNLGTGSASDILEQYAIHGDRVLVLRPSKDAVRESIVVVSNWTSLLPSRPTTSTPAP